jgi:plastocyanin
MTFRWQTIPITVVLALGAVGYGCKTPEATSPTIAGPFAAPPPDAPAIVGTVLMGTTKAPPPSGGIVYLEDAPKEPGALMTERIDVDHKNFKPFIAVITTGGAVTFGNKDALAHHVFSPDVPKWDTGLLHKDETTAPKTFDAPGAIALLCNIHPEMLGYLVVIPSTFYGRIGRDGRYAIEKVPPGTYKVSAWAPRIPVTTQPVTVAAVDALVAKDFELHPAN